MKKYLLMCFSILIITSLVVIAEDDIEVTKVVVSKGVEGFNSEPTYALNFAKNSSVIVWSCGSTTEHVSKIYAVYVKPKSNGKLKFSKPRLISNKTDYNFAPSIAFNDASNSYMVVWASQVKNNDTHLLARKLNSSGRPKGGIVKISSENLVQNSNPKISSFQEPLIALAPAAQPRFIVLWDKSWPTYVSKPSGLHCLQLSATGQPASVETFVFDAPKDQDTGEAVPLLVSNIVDVFGGWYYVAVNRGYSNSLTPPGDNRDTWVFMFTSPTDWYPALQSFNGLRTAGQLFPLSDQGVIHTWYDGFGTELTYTRTFKQGPKKSGGIKKPIKKETTYASCLMQIWSDIYLYNYAGNGQLQIFKMKENGKVDERVGSLDLEDSMGQYMFAYWANGGKKAMLVSEVVTDDQNFLYDIVAYHFDAPGWENQEGSEK
jgi:hypothetical protein